MTSERERRRGSPAGHESTAATNPPPGESAIEIDRAALRYGSSVIFEDLSLSVRAGEFVCLLGPSGCGKSTLLRILGGLQTASDVHSISVLDGPPEARWNRLAYVFQQPRLVPWRTALDNVVLGMELRNGPSRRQRTQRREIAAEYLDRVGIGDLADRRAHALSGGEQQRVAIARAIALEPSLLLMDEPFSALDVQTRSVLRTMVVDLWRQLGITIVFVTHDVLEALAVASRIIVLSGKPTEVVADLEIPVDHPRQPNSRELAPLRAELFTKLGLTEQLEGPDLSQ